VSRPPDFERELTIAIAAARRAAAAILDHRSRPVVSIKPDGSPVTSADYAADAAIRAIVSEPFPADAILSEEGDDDRYTHGGLPVPAGTLRSASPHALQRIVRS
jgi:fructose-1,6-bisphosphatase/inositol monophosphatase family enzyme